MEPQSRDSRYRFLFTRKKSKKLRKGALQLHLYEPRDLNYDYKVIVTNNSQSAKNVVLFQNGQGSQECVFGDTKNNTTLDVIPSRQLAINQLFPLCLLIAHNFSRPVQMLATPSVSRARPKRPAAWRFDKFDTLRHLILQKSVSFTRPQGELTLTLSTNHAVRKDLLGFLDVLQKAAWLSGTKNPKIYATLR